jgi:hypothetical protein
VRGCGGRFAIARLNFPADCKSAATFALASVPELRIIPKVMVMNPVKPEIAISILLTQSIMLV